MSGNNREFPQGAPRVRTFDGHRFDIVGNGVGTRPYKGNWRNVGGVGTFPPRPVVRVMQCAPTRIPADLGNHFGE